MKLNRKKLYFFCIMKQLFPFLVVLLLFIGCKKQETLVISEDDLEQTEQELQLERKN